jgi:hypothetical protein
LGKFAARLFAVYAELHQSLARLTKVYTCLHQFLLRYANQSDQPADEAFDNQQSGPKTPETFTN